MPSKRPPPSTPKCVPSCKAPWSARSASCGSAATCSNAAPAGCSKRKLSTNTSSASSSDHPPARASEWPRSSVAFVPSFRGEARRAESPESITPVCGYGFRVRRFAAPRNDGAYDWNLGNAVLLRLIIVAGLVLAPERALAAPALDGAALRWPWAVPFVGILLTIAIGPLLFARTWHRHYGKLAFIWSTLTVAPLAAIYGVPAALAAFVHAMLGEFSSFIVLLFALYVIAGGILVTGNLRGTPLLNTAILALGTAIASVVGTTGAAMILIRPLIQANAARLHNAHVVIFFILLIGNIGGAPSPLGGPPLPIGFLHAADFLWPARHLLLQTA